MIVSSHVLNEVERLAERVIVHHPRAARRRRRSPGDPRRDGRPAAARVRAGRRQPSPGRVAGRARRRWAASRSTDTATGSCSRRHEPASWRPRSPAARPGHQRPTARGPRPRRLAGEPVQGVGAMTVPHAGDAPRPAAIPVRRDRRLHAALVPAAEAAGSAVALPCAGALLFGLLAHAIDNTPTARSRTSPPRRSSA